MTTRRRTGGQSCGGRSTRCAEAVRIPAVIYANLVQELERQVRLKLGLYQTSQEEDQTEGDVGTALSRYSQLSKIVRTRHNRTATECEFPHVAGSGGCVPVEHDSEVAREEWGKEEKKNAVLQKKGKEMSCKVSDLGQKAQLFLHLNKLGSFTCTIASHDSF